MKSVKFSFHLNKIAYPKVKKNIEREDILSY